MERVWHKAYDSRTPPRIEIERSSVPEIFARTARRFPDRPCVHFLDVTLSYRDVDREAARLAAALSTLGVGPGVRVAVHLPNLPQTVISLFAILRLGAHVVMTNPLYVAREIEHQWQDAECEVAIVADYLYASTLRPLTDRLPVKHWIVTHIPDYLRFPVRQLATWKLGRARPALYAPIEMGSHVHAWRDFVRPDAPEPPAPTIGFDDVAMLQYTGGTTGLSKGAMLSHGNLSSQVQQLRAWFPDLEDGREVFLGALPLFHIFGLTVVCMLAVHSGSSMVMVPNPRDIPRIARSLHKHRVTLLPAVPALFNSINNYPRVDRMDLRSIKQCFSGSAPLPLSVLDRFESLTGGVIVEGFGLTETSPVTHANPLRGHRKIGTVGVPISNTDARIVDAETGTKELPVGEEGELIVKGPQIMIGYWKRPEETAAVLRDGWFHTGDLAARDEDGYFSIVGRKKDMILASGYNIYPDEIDRILMAHAAVAECCTIGVPDPKRGETVKSFVVRKDGAEVSAETLIAYCRENLAAYKVPRLIEFRDELPRSSLLKLLRRVLLDEELAKIKESGRTGGHSGTRGGTGT